MKAQEKQQNRRRKETRSCVRCEYKFDINKSKCPSCGAWNNVRAINDGGDQTILLSEVSDNPIKRIQTGPWDKCFGQDSSSGECGIATCQVILLGGAPGAGKSTMALQLADRIAQNTKKEIIYIGSEESPPQIKDRAIRLGIISNNLIRLHPMGSSADLGSILLNRKPSGIILDSLPGLTKDPDLAVELCTRFKEYTVELNAPTIIIDHVTKDGDMAGLMALQHEVDTLIMVFKDDGNDIREMVTVKNRFGPTCSEYFKMTSKGLFLHEDNTNNDDENDDET